jgi:hypothetical protein
MSNKALRNAFATGAGYVRSLYGLVDYPPGMFTADLAAARNVYPPKTETRPREVEVRPRYFYRVKDGEVQYQSPGFRDWVPSVDFELGEQGQLTLHQVFAKHPERAGEVAIILDLIANPTETVEVDD